MKQTITPTDVELLDGIAVSADHAVEARLGLLESLRTKADLACLVLGIEAWDENKRRVVYKWLVEDGAQAGGSLERLLTELGVEVNVEVKS